jgi:glucokinase
MTAPTLLLADLGGTNTRVALATGRTVRHETIRRIPNKDHPNLDSVLSEYLRAEGAKGVDGACVAAAGPVRDGIAEMTNLSWVIRPEDVAAVTGATEVAILNDLQAQGHALGYLAPGTTRQVLPGQPQGPGASQLVVGVGTGFNAAPVHEGRGGRIVAASECGHVALPVRTPEDLGLALFVQQAHGYPEVEEVLSGRGVERVYEWVATNAGSPSRRTAAEIMAAIETGDTLAIRAGEVFVRALGTVIGELALIHLPFGGIYLIGGVARAFAPHFVRFGLAPAFRDKGRFSELMDEFPLSVVEDDYAALTGCASYLSGLLRI